MTLHTPYATAECVTCRGQLGAFGVAASGAAGSEWRYALTDWRHQSPTYVHAALPLHSTIVETERGREIFPDRGPRNT
ncbi:MAG TPA: hypothetical protein VD864_13295, partial [Nocardioides sp.]|nr:hypothetical protein [Nocardioides sp.]